MIRLDFHRQETGRLIARVQAGDLASMPAVDDRIYAPSAEDPGVYACFRVAGREFYYDQRGDLALIKMGCVELTSPSVAPPETIPGAAERDGRDEDMAQSP